MEYTHTYDGQLKINFTTPNDLDEKRKRGTELITAVKHFNPLALHFLTTIVNDIGMSSNFDATNNISADDLIFHTWNYRFNPEFLIQLELQLLDMQTGFCPQGRVCRLYQLLCAF